MSWLHRVVPQVVAAWKSTKVELQGWLSPSRLRGLETYVANTTTWRVLLVCLLSPLPCLALILSLDAVPLVPPEAGVAANYMFWIRGWLVTCYVDCNAILMIGHGLPQLDFSLWHIVVIGSLAASCSMVTVVTVVSTIAFPFPFGFLVASPPSCMVIFAGFSYFWGEQWRTDEALRRALVGQISVFTCQVTLTFVYPMFISVFQTLDVQSQTFFVLVLPIIKITSKNWISHALADKHDIKPKAVIFSVEVFHALYISIAMQSSTSIRTTLVLMVLDLLQCLGSVRNIVMTLRDVRQLMRKIPRGHPLENKSALHVAVQLQAINERRGVQSLSRVATSKKKTSRRSSVSPELGPGLKQPREQYDNVKHHPEPATSIKSKSKHDSKTSTNNNSTGGGKPSARKMVPTNHPGPMPSDITNSDSTTVDVQGIRSPEAIANAIPDSKASPLALENIFTRQECITFVHQTTRALFTAEYVALVEYTEVVVPIIYSIYLLVLFQMPNCVYYTSLAALDDVQRVNTITNVLTYASLELASLVITSLVLKRVLGMSIITQLAFVLDAQKIILQARLSTWVVYVLQIPLVHMGADFTFQFAWLHQEK